MVTAVNKEVLSGTDQVMISCQVTGITAPLGNVTWTDSDGNDVTTLATASSYTIVDGTLQNGNSQTTTLMVASNQTTADKTYSCLVTPAFPDDATEVRTSVALDVYSKSYLYSTEVNLQTMNSLPIPYFLKFRAS